MSPFSPRRFALLCAVAMAAGGCAGHWTLPDPTIAAAAAATTTYSARLRIVLDGPTLRARTPVLIAFRRPDALRIEVPGPAGPRLVAVAAAGRLWATFPSERAVFSGPATEGDFEALLGIALTPAEVIDLLVGLPPARLRTYDARWRGPLPARIRATLPDGGRLAVDVFDPERGAALPDQAFAEPAHAGYRVIAAAEARRFWGGR
jgi:hypothetical protein